MGGFIRGVRGPGSPTDRSTHFPEEERLGLEVGSQAGWGWGFQKGAGLCPALGGPGTTRAACQALLVIYSGAQWALSSPEEEVSQRGAVVAPHHTAVGLAGASLRGQDLAAGLGAARAWWSGELTAAPCLHHGPEGVREGLKEPRVAACGIESTPGLPCVCHQAGRGEKLQQAPRTDLTVMLKTT